MKKLLAIAVLGCLTAARAHATCSYPLPPDKIPDGSKATKAEMVAAMKAVRAYNDAVNAYNACLPFERDDRIAKPGAPLTKEQENQLKAIEIQKHNSAVDVLQNVADRFNEQVRIYKARTDTKKG